MTKRIQDAVSRFGEEACIMAYYFNVKQGEGGTFIETNTGIPKRSQGAAIAAGEYLMKGIKKNPVKPRKGESERKFVSRCMSEEKMSFPKQKQRIAVCLSKARKNPLLESGATISRNSGINRRAASMT